jgi:acetyl-CoA/propionyl-CoA carboxylase biotin carboxyl carrier protein
MQGTVLKVLVAAGQEVAAGDVVCIVEAMKMENEVPAAQGGNVQEVRVEAGQSVSAGDVLAVIA